MAKKKVGKNVWDRFSRIGIIFILLYLLFIIIGFSIRLIFFNNQKTTSIVPDMGVVSAEGTENSSNENQSNTSSVAATTEPTSTSQNIVSITMNNDYLAVLEGGTGELQVDMQTTGNAVASDLIWSSSDESVATVDNSGVVTGVKKGTCTITAQVKGNEDLTTTADVVVRHLEEKDGITYVDGIMIVNKTYGLPSDYDPGQSEEAMAAFDQLSADAAEEGLNIYVGSSYRDYNYQVTIFNNYSELYGQEEADKFSARPGHSEHQTGLTIDCNTIDDAFGETEEAKWLAEHCAEYGFIIRFPEGKDSITGYQYEPWHIRYVGKEVAEEINSRGLTLEEYLGVESVYTESWDEESH